MLLKLDRVLVVGEATIGRLSVDGRSFCDTIEDLVRAVKIAGNTAIPAGTYPVKITHSNRFSASYGGILMPLIEDVPNYTGVRIHAGNTPEDTDGCVLVGFYDAKTNRLINSRATFGRLHKLLSSAKTPLSISIE